jgi:hypothetical protein
MSNLSNTGRFALNATKFKDREIGEFIKVENLTESQTVTLNDGTIIDIPKISTIDSTGKIDISTIGNGDPDSTKYLCGDGTWSTVIAQGGTQGLQGYTGLNGTDGLQGATGSAGTTGSQGPTGPAGSTGPQGPTGPAGLQGFNGSTGPQGPAGSTGPTGPTGPTGSRGLQGYQGASGANVNWTSLSSSLIPVNSAYSLGSTSYTWSNVYGRNIFGDTIFKMNGSTTSPHIQLGISGSLALNLSYGDFISFNSTYILSSGTRTLGTSTNKWGQIYSTNSTISTSDAREKIITNDKVFGLDFISKLEPISYKLNNIQILDEFTTEIENEIWEQDVHSIIEPREVTKFDKELGTYVKVTEDTVVNRIPLFENVNVYDSNGNAISVENQPKMIKRSIYKNAIKSGDRSHWGLISQQVKSVMDELNLSSTDFAGWCLADPNDPESGQMLRYEEFIAPLIQAVKELHVELKEIKTSLDRV